MTIAEAQSLAVEIGCCPEHDEMVKRLVRDYIAEKERCAKIVDENVCPPGKTCISEWCADRRKLANKIRSS
jgi:hypothetical protein